MNSYENEQRAAEDRHADRSTWKRPQVTRFDAGRAEVAADTTSDGFGATDIAS